MFATLSGGLPRPPLPDGAAAGSLVDAALAAQVEAGLEPVSDGGWWGDRSPSAAWADTAGRTDRLVKQVVSGPFSATAGRAPAKGSNAGVDSARALNDVLRSLAAAGCPFVEIHEPAMARIGDDRSCVGPPPGSPRRHDRRRDRCAPVAGGDRRSRSTRPGSMPSSSAPFASYALDLIAGPENWRFVRAVPGERGIVCGALGVGPGADEGPEVLLWAAAYAASSQGRGPDRVGLSTASSLADLSWD